MDKRLQTSGFTSKRDSSAPAQSVETRRIDLRELLGDRGEVVIIHGGREYRLRVTSNGKLILTA